MKRKHRKRQRFVELSAMPEGDEKSRLMKDFFKRENWLSPREQQRLEDMRRAFGGSPITYSEMRRAAKISKEASLRRTTPS